MSVSGQVTGIRGKVRGPSGGRMENGTVDTVADTDRGRIRAYCEYCTAAVTVLFQD